MGFLRWLKRGRSERLDPRLVEWRREWTTASANGQAASVESLRARLDSIGFPAEETEIEREMLEGLEALVQLRDHMTAEGLPVVETGHRVIGADRCHFTAPVSMPDDDAQPSGRLLLTSSRAIFVGGSRPATLAWHAVAEVLHHDRDVLLVRKDREQLYRFRCNSFADALCATYLAQRLSARRSEQPAPQPGT